MLDANRFDDSQQTIGDRQSTSGKCQYRISRPGSVCTPVGASTLLTSNSAPSRRCSFISSAAAVGVSIPKFSDHHHRLSPQTPCGPSNYGPGGADHDPVSCLYPLPGLLPPPDPQPCARKMRDLSRMRQENRLLVRGPGRQQRLISTYADRDVFSQGSTAKLTKRRR
jgi:hypothetical protein